MTTWMTFSFVRISIKGGKPVTGKRGAGLLNDKSVVSTEIEERVKLVYNDCWRIYKEYIMSHDMAQYNRRITELMTKYSRDEFLLSILWAFVPVVTALHAEYLKNENK